MKPCLFNFFRSCQYGFWPRSANRARRRHNATTARARLRYFLAGLAILLVASVCDAQTRQELATLKGHDDVVYSVVFSPDSKTLASGSWDETVKLWDARTGQGLATLKGHVDRVSSVAFSALTKAAPRSDVVEWASVPSSMREPHSPTCTEPSAPD